MSESQTVQIRFQQDLLGEVDQRAAELGITRSALVKLALAAYLDAKSIPAQSSQASVRDVECRRVVRELEARVRALETRSEAGDDLFG